MCILNILKLYSKYKGGESQNASLKNAVNICIMSNEVKTHSRVAFVDKGLDNHRLIIDFQHIP